MAAMIREYITLPPTFHAYDPQAVVAAQHLISAIRAQDERLQIEHVGSSAVPGWGGKGYIGLLVIYPDGQLDGAKQVLVDLGFPRQ